MENSNQNKKSAIQEFGSDVWKIANKLNDKLPEYLFTNTINSNLSHKVPLKLEQILLGAVVHEVSIKFPNTENPYLYEMLLSYFVTNIIQFESTYNFPVSGILKKENNGLKFSKDLIKKLEKEWLKIGNESKLEIDFNLKSNDDKFNNTIFTALLRNEDYDNFEALVQYCFDNKYYIDPKITDKNGYNILNTLISSNASDELINKFIDIVTIQDTSSREADLQSLNFPEPSEKKRLPIVQCMINGRAGVINHMVEKNLIDLEEAKEAKYGKFKSSIFHFLHPDLTEESLKNFGIDSKRPENSKWNKLGNLQSLEEANFILMDSVNEKDRSEYCKFLLESYKKNPLPEKEDLSKKTVIDVKEEGKIKCVEFLLSLGFKISENANGKLPQDIEGINLEIKKSLQEYFAIPKSIINPKDVSGFIEQKQQGKF